MQIGEILIKEKIITESQLEEALKIQKNSPGKMIGEILIELDYIDIEKFTKYLGQQMKEEGMTR